MTRSTTIAAACIVLLGASTAVADSLTTEEQGLSYGNIRIQDVRDCQLIFATPGGQARPRPVYALRKVQVTGQADFNEAETLASDDKWADAARSYDKALARRGIKAWMKQLIAIRRLRAMNKAAMISQAVDQWFDLVEANKASAASLAMAPTQFPARGDKANSLAIAALQKQIAKVGDNKAYANAISALLIALYRHEGLDDKAGNLAEKITSAGTPDNNARKSPAPVNGKTSPPPTRLGPSVPRRLSTVQTLMESGKTAQALSIIERSLRQYQIAELPAALLLRGKAQTMLAETAQPAEKQKLLLDAGLNFMRTAAYFPAGDEAPEALLEAAEVHTKLVPPNRAAAISAYQAVISRYSDSPAATRAKKALAALQSEQ